MELFKAKYFAFFFMLVLLTSGFPLNASSDGDMIPTADAAVKTTDNGNKIFFCENNPIKKTEYDKPHMKPQDYMSKCKERTDGYSWGSRITYYFGLRDLMLMIKKLINWEMMGMVKV